jgi:hypothetical protein
LREIGIVQLTSSLVKFDSSALSHVLKLAAGRFQALQQVSDLRAGGFIGSGGPHPQREHSEECREQPLHGR